MIPQLSRAKLKFFSALRLKKFRYARKLFLCEGKKLVSEALSAQLVPAAFLIHTENILLREALSLPPDKCFTLTTEMYKTLSEQPSPEGIIGVFELPENILINPKLTPGILLDRIQDPGNLGAVLRSAEWFGFKAVICSHGTVDVFNAKVLRAAMGAAFRIPVFYPDDFEAFIEIHANDIWAADLEGEAIDKTNLSSRNYLLMGNEAQGLSQKIRKIEGLSYVHIPGMGKTESLNIAVSMGILAYRHFSGRQ